jgi:hypothetical protein
MRYVVWLAGWLARVGFMLFITDLHRLARDFIDSGAWMLVFAALLRPVASLWHKAVAPIYDSGLVGHPSQR